MRKPGGLAVKAISRCCAAEDGTAPCAQANGRAGRGVGYVQPQTQAWKLPGSVAADGCGWTPPAIGQMMGDRAPLGLADESCACGDLVFSTVGHDARMGDGEAHGRPPRGRARRVL
ncbi:hypothetical protein XAB3213_1620006 [Xanthomonas citri pv. bilvae]|nr:hypothetical protein XAB3213_1620006 [Xanthomonas citri pv. bilvae]